MEDNSYRQINRRKTRQINVGSVLVGGDAQITVQSMTNTETTDIEATLAQIRTLEDAGADIVRVSTPTRKSVAAFAELVKESNIPLIADIHYHYKLAIEAAKAGAACLRVNPGNIGGLDNVREVIAAAKDADASIRIGVNAGSLEKHLLEKYGSPTPEALVESAMDHIKLLEDNDFLNFKVAVKASDVFLMATAYRQLAEQTDAPFHVGVTESGSQASGTVKSSIGIGGLLWDGIGDTIRVSLSADPVEEIKVGFEILKSLGIRARGVQIISCPSCARQNFDVIDTVQRIEQRIAHIRTSMTVSILGCAVNGVGEAQHTDIGLTGGGQNTHMLFNTGQLDHRFTQEDVVDYMVEQIEAKAAEISKTLSKNNKKEAA